MKGKAVVIGLILVIGIALVVLNRGDEAPRPPLVAEGFKAPDIEVLDVNGNAWRLSAHRGDVVLVNFWASWCKECREEMPSLQRLYDRLETSPDFEMVLIVFNEDLGDSAEFMDENDYTMPFYADPGSTAARSFGLTGVPETYIVSKDGVIKKKIIGPTDFDNPSAREFILRLLEEEKEA